MTKTFIKPQILLGEARIRQGHKSNTRDLVQSLHADASKAAHLQLVGIVDSFISDYDDFAFMGYSGLAPWIIDHDVQFNGEFAQHAGGIFQGVGAAGAAAGLASTILMYKDAHDQKKVEFERIAIMLELLLAEERKHAQYRNHDYLNLSNDKLKDVLMAQNFSVLDDHQKNKTRKIAAEVFKTYNPPVKTKLQKVLDSVETASDFITRVNTGFGIVLYPFYYFGAAIVPMMIILAAFVGTLIGSARFASKKYSTHVKENSESTIEDYSTYYQQRISMLKRMRAIQEKKAKNVVEIDDELKSKINAYYDDMQKRHTKHKHLARAQRFQFMGILGFLFGVVPVKLVFWFSAIALTTSAFYIAAPLVGALFMTMYIYKAYKETKRLEAEINDKIDYLRGHEATRLSRWAGKYNENVSELSDQIDQQSEAQLMSMYLSKIRTFNEDEIDKMTLLLSKSSGLEIDFSDAHFYNRLLHNLGDDARPGIVVLKDYMSNNNVLTGTDVDLEPEKPGPNYKKIALNIGKVMSVAAPIFIGVFMASAFFGGPIGVGVMVGIAVIGLTFLAIGMYAQYKREQQLAELTAREHKIDIMDRIVKVDYKNEHALEKAPSVEQPKQGSTDKPKLTRTKGVLFDRAGPKTASGRAKGMVFNQRSSSSSVATMHDGLLTKSSASGSSKGSVVMVENERQSYSSAQKTH